MSEPAQKRRRLDLSAPCLLCDTDSDSLSSLLSFLDTEDKLRTAVTCKKMNQACMDPRVWRVMDVPLVPYGSYVNAGIQGTEVLNIDMSYRVGESFVDRVEGMILIKKLVGKADRLREISFDGIDSDYWDFEGPQNGPINPTRFLRAVVNIRPLKFIKLSAVSRGGGFCLDSMRFYETSELEELWLHDVRLHDWSIGGLSSIKTLTKLTITNGLQSQEALHKVFEATQIKSLDLDMDHYRIDDNIAKLTNLESLSLTGFDSIDIGFLLHMPHLRSLEIYNARITGDWAGIEACTQLHNLRIIASEMPSLPHLDELVHLENACVSMFVTNLTYSTKTKQWVVPVARHRG